MARGPKHRGAEGNLWVDLAVRGRGSGTPEVRTRSGSASANWLPRRARRRSRGNRAASWSRSGAPDQTDIALSRRRPPRSHHFPSAGFA